MAWAGTTTEFDPIVLGWETVKVSTNNSLVNSTVEHDDATGHAPGTLRLTTHTDVVRFPYNQPNGKMVIFANLLAPDTSIGYCAVAVRYPESSDGVAWRSPPHAGTSTAESGWKMFYSTNFSAATSQGISFVAGPFESAKWGNWSATSTRSIDANQPFLEMMFMMTTAADTAFLVAASSSRSELMNVAAFEVP